MSQRSFFAIWHFRLWEYKKFVMIYLHGSEITTQPCINAIFLIWLWFLNCGWKAGSLSISLVSFSSLIILVFISQVLVSTGVRWSLADPWFLLTLVIRLLTLFYVFLESHTRPYNVCDFFSVSRGYSLDCIPIDRARSVISVLDSNFTGLCLSAWR